MTARIWILGASDPEMTAIETLLRDAGETVAYAVGPDGQRVHPGNAYRSEQVGCPAATCYVGDMYLVECDLAQHYFGPAYFHPTTGFVRMATDGTEEYLGESQSIRIDHHRPGDPGYGRPPEEFLAASGIGQVVAVLLRLGITDGVTDPDGVSFTPDGPGGVWGLVRRDIVMTAAADHCLEAAYRGRCPGVDPDALMRWRAESRAAFLGVPVDAVMADVESARLRLRVTQAASGSLPDAPCWHHEYADLRGEAIPELPEAACREGIAYLASVRDRDGRQKVTLGAASPDLVRRFMAGDIVPGLTGYYGDPARGFAGGYVSPTVTS